MIFPIVPDQNKKYKPQIVYSRNTNMFDFFVSGISAAILHWHFQNIISRVCSVSISIYPIRLLVGFIEVQSVLNDMI